MTRRLLLILALLLLGPDVAAAGSMLLKQSTAFTRDFVMIASSDHIAGKTAETVSCTLSKAGGAFAASGGAVTELANWWYKIALNTTDTNTLGQLAYHCTSANTDASDFDDQVVVIDLTDAVRLGLTSLPNANAGANTGLPVVGTQVPNATAGAAGGLLISGANSGTTTFGAVTITGTFTISDGIVVTRSSSNASALSLTGNGTGHGLIATSGAGATGDGIRGVAGSTNGNGLTLLGVGTGAGLAVTGGATGSGFSLTGGATSGAGLSVTTTAGDGFSITPTAGNAITATANGTSKHGLVATGGTAGTSDGIKGVAGTGGVDIRGNLTGNVTGNLSGSAGSVTGAVGSVTGNVGGSVASVTARVTANTDQFAGAAVALDGNNLPKVDVEDTKGTALAAALGVDVNGRIKIQGPLNKNVASTKFPFMMTDSTNHNPDAGLAPACTRSLDAGAFAAGTLANILGVSNGAYVLDFGAGDLNGGYLMLRCTAAAADDTFVTLPIYP